MINNKYRWIFITLLVIFTLGCSLGTILRKDITQGAAKEEVIAWYGKPDQTQEFILPDTPFFGPSEGLANLVPPGTLIEEWVYEVGDENLYVWFTGDPDDKRDSWLVLNTARSPKGAVY